MKRAFIIIIIIVLVLSLIFISAGYKSNSNFNLNNWMKVVDDSTLVRDIIMPGSHDAATYECMFFDDTQDLSIYEQLGIGVRYFDLRVTDTPKGDIKKMKTCVCITVLYRLLQLF